MNEKINTIEPKQKPKSAICQMFSKVLRTIYLVGDVIIQGIKFEVQTTLPSFKSISPTIQIIKLDKKNSSLIKFIFVKYLRIKPLYQRITEPFKTSIQVGSAI